MKITSSAFGDHEMIPDEYTCDGANVNPPLSFHDVPEEVKSLALVMDDPDVPSFVRADNNWDHWVVWNIPPTSRGIERDSAPGGVEGRNTGGRNAYGGPCPPDRQHRYFFKLYALDRELGLPPTAGKQELLRAMEGHVLASAELVGVYDRRSRRG